MPSSPMLLRLQSRSGAALLHVSKDETFINAINDATEVNFRGNTETCLVPYKDENALKVEQVRTAIGETFEIEAGDLAQCWLVFKGRRLADWELTKDLGIGNYSKIYLGLAGSRGASRESMGEEEELELKQQIDGSSPIGSSSTTSSSSSAPNLAHKSPLKDFFNTIIANNPEMMLEMISMNPKMKSLMARNPAIKHALSDPSTLKELLAASSDPRAYAESMRGHDRALANIENIPGGFQALQQFYTRELAEMEDDLQDLRLDGAGRESRDNEGSKSYDSRGKLVTEPMPNPWSPTRHSHTASSSLNASQTASPLGSSRIAAQSPSANLFASSLFFASQSASSRTSDGISQNIPEATARARNQTPLPEGDFDTTPYESRFSEQLAKMHEMGFTDTRQNIRALLSRGGNVKLAIDLLTERSLETLPK